ncbi:pantothenate kinase [Virgibacillus profundi]|uniref:Type III pantothenate kinase n=1 Tax=Virgibacillus profundi TaxID=2024555 RepID=A0A2A2I999_9BACI|nr:type III pantothenate kinase [Virgibacillus profundi]PAV28581.1 pantothenate kinase [Virgibacillus profundi]PXY52755.1 type III pantothenate kinase [Virgibacillus profundi]
MLFVLDVGNTNTVLGVFDEDHLKHEWRIKTDRHKTEDEFGMLIKSLFDHKGIAFSDITAVIISSVVPPIMFALEKMSKDYFKLEPLIIGKETVRSFLEMRYPNPQEIGADRIVNAVGAIEQYGAPLIIIDFGTATTFCYVNDNKEYQGGIISPGINISMEALYSKASKLPKIEIQSPNQVIGSSTVEAMQSGVFYGYVGQVDGIVNRIKEDMNIKPTVIATGGLASLIAGESTTIDHVDPHLTLKGLYLIYQKNN